MYDIANQNYNKMPAGASLSERQFLETAGKPRHDAGMCIAYFIHMKYAESSRQGVSWQGEGLVKFNALSQIVKQQ